MGSKNPLSAAMKPTSTPISMSPSIAWPAAEDDDADRGHGRHELDGREVGGVELDGDEVGLAVDVVELGEVRAMARLLREGAHDADARQRLLQVDGDGADRLARAPVGVGARHAEGQRSDRHHREDEEGHQRELHVEEEQDHDRADERQRGLEEGDHRVGDQRVQRLDVVGHARDEHARGPALVEPDRLLLEVAEDLQAQVGERALADPADQVGLRVRRAQTTSALATKATTTRSSVPRRPSGCPSRSRSWPAAPARATRRCPARAR
jgi:hypothetical protein